MLPLAPDTVFFDLDGVVVWELDVVNNGYRFLLAAVKTGRTDLQQEEAEQLASQQEADAVRSVVKGLHPLTKVRMLQDLLSPPGAGAPPGEIAAAWYSYMRKYVVRNYPPDRYIVPGAERLLRRLAMQYHVVVVTACPTPEAEWLLQYIGVREIFSDILAYGPEVEGLGTKTQLLANYLRIHPTARGAAMVGDGATDMQAAKANGLRGVGVYLTDLQKQSLEDAGAARVFRVGEEYEELGDWLLKQ